MMAAIYRLLTADQCASSDSLCEDQQKQHVVVCAYPAQGHLIPALHFSKLLVSAGFLVTYVCAQHRMADLRKRVLHQYPPEAAHMIKLVALPDRVPMGQHGIDEGPESFSWSMENSKRMKGDFERLIRDLMMNNDSAATPTCIISDIFLPWTQDVANQFSIPRYLFFPSPAALLCIFMYLPVLLKQGQIPVKTLTTSNQNTQTNQYYSSSSDLHSTTLDRDQVRIPGLPPLFPRDMPNSLKDTCSKDWQEFVIESALRIHESSAIIVNTVYELEKSAVDALQNETINPRQVPVHLVGPLLPSNFLRQDSFLRSLRAMAISERERICLEWLDNRPSSSVLYVSLGSIAILSVAQIRQFALGLEASGQFFLWVLRQPRSSCSDYCSANAASSCASSVSSIRSPLPKGFHNRTSSRGLVVTDWAPQLLILSHPSVGGFLTHCGWNSVLESICQGIPMLAFPQFAEQHLNCKMLVDRLKVAIQIQMSGSDIDGTVVAKKGEIERNVSNLFHSDEGRMLKKNAVELGDKIRKKSATIGDHTLVDSKSLLQLFI